MSPWPQYLDSVYYGFLSSLDFTVYKPFGVITGYDEEPFIMKKDFFSYSVFQISVRKL